MDVLQLLQLCFGLVLSESVFVLVGVDKQTWLTQTSLTILEQGGLLRPPEPISSARTTTWGGRPDSGEQQALRNSRETDAADSGTGCGTEAADPAGPRESA